MQRRLDLAMGLVGSPRIVFLDEPTAGLDPPAHHVGGHQEPRLGGVTIFLTTQYLEEADRLADRVALLDSGSLVAQGPRTSSSAWRPGGIELRFAALRISSRRRACSTP